MNYTDSITKNFLTGRGQFGSRITDELTALSRWTNYDDPIYMGFFFKFNPNTIFDPNNQDLDYLPQGLFLGAKDYKYRDQGNGATNQSNDHPDSAVNYLARRGEYYRSNMIREFRDGMIEISENTPWVFEKVSGLGDLWKADPKVNWRTKDKKITFECNENIGMKLTYLIDLYRKASFDYEYMRHTLPDTQRYFSMDLYVMEIRTINNAGALWNPGFICFRLEFCEFDVFTESPAYLDNLSTYAGEGAKVKFTIKVGKVKEFNRYNVMGALLSDTSSVYSRGKTNAQNSFTQDTTVKDATGTNLANPISTYTAITNTDYSFGYNQKQQNSGLGYNSNQPGVIDPDFPLNWSAQTPPVERPADLGPLATAALSYAQDAIENVANRALLGNVYGLSLATLGGQLQGILNNPIAAVQGIVSNFTANQQQTDAILNNVQLSGPDIQLISNAIGAIQNLPPSINLENITVADLLNDSPAASQLLQGTPATQPLQAPNIVPAALGKETLESTPQTSGNLGKETLTGPNILGSTLGKILFETSTSNVGSPGKVTLSAPSSSIQGGPEKQELTGKGSIEGTQEKVILESPKIPAGGLGKEDLSAPPASSLGNTSVNLEAPPVGGESGGKVDLLSNGATLEGDKQSQDLEGPLKGRLDASKVKLEAPEIKKTSPGSENLSGANVKLQQDDLGNSNLESPPTKDGELGNVNLE
jgi:hypothetical protein